MKNANKSKGQKILAMAIVAMFAMCAFAVCVPSDSDAGVYGGVTEGAGSTRVNQIYNIDITKGQTFTYSGINTNLDDAEGTVTVNGSGTGTATVKTGFGAPVKDDSNNKYTVTGSFGSTGTYTYKLTATWTHTPVEGGKTLTQTATQSLVFNVIDSIDIKPTTKNGYGILNEAEKSFELAYSGTTDYAPTITGTGSENFSAAFNGAGTAIVITPKAGTNNAVKTFDGLTVKVENTATGDKDSCTVKYQVFEKIVVESQTDYTYENATDGNKDVTMDVKWVASASDGTIDSKTFTFAPADQTVLTEVGTGEGKLSQNVTAAQPGAIVTSGTKSTFTATLTANGTIEGNTTSSTGTYTLIVYKQLAFMQKPTASNISIAAVGNNTSSIILSSYITGAHEVTINWGDGMMSKSAGVDANTFSGFHNYAKAGMYTITISATNDMGTTTEQVLYNAGEGDITIPETPETPAEPEEKSFFDEHGIQFLIFAILVIVFAIAFFYFGIQSPFVLILMIVFAALSVLCFVYNDIGGIIDAVKGFKL